MRRRRLKRLWARLNQLSTMALSREEPLMKLGAARDQSRTAWRLVTIEVAAEDAAFSYRLDRNKLRSSTNGAPFWTRVALAGGAERPVARRVSARPPVRRAVRRGFYPGEFFGRDCGHHADLEPVRLAMSS